MRTKWQNKRRKEIKEYIYQYMSNNHCVDCGETDVRVLQCDHIRGEKKYNIFNIYKYTTSWEKIKAEFLKCDVVCANCHFIRTAKQFNWYKGQGPMVKSGVHASLSRKRSRVQIPLGSQITYPFLVE